MNAYLVPLGFVVAVLGMFAVNAFLGGLLSLQFPARANPRLAGRRLTAAAIDLLFIVLLAILVGWVLLRNEPCALHGKGSSAEPLCPMPWFDFVLIYDLSFYYLMPVYFLLEVFFPYSPGKRMLRLCIVTRSGERSRASIRIRRWAMKVAPCVIVGGLYAATGFMFEFVLGPLFVAYWLVCFLPYSGIFQWPLWDVFAGTTAVRRSTP